MVISCGIVVVRNDDELRYLLLRSYDYWDFPKGKMEPNEDPLETALRETNEETGITADELNFRWGRVNKESDKYKKGRKFVIYFIAETDRENIDLPVNDELGRPEHDEYRWMTYDEASQVLVPRVKKILDWAKELIEG